MSPSAWDGSAVVHSSKSGSQLVFELSERALSFRLTTSTPGMVTGIENSVRNDGSGPYQKHITCFEDRGVAPKVVLEILGISSGP